MSKSKSLFKSCLFGCLLTTFTLGSFASDADRITQFEKEVQELKIKLANLESPSNKPPIGQKHPASSAGWKNLANWRSLKTGMSYDDVRMILGEPARIAGGEVAFWFYQNRGSVIFHSHQLDSWTEPR